MVATSTNRNKTNLSNVEQPSTLKGFKEIDDWIIRAFELRDLDEISKLEQEVFGIYKAYPLFFFRQALDLFHDLFYIAEYQNKNIAGYALGALQPNNLNGWVLHIGARAEYRCTGIGTTLINNLIQSFSRKETKSVLLTVASNNEAAIRIYQRFGFYQIDTEDNYYGIGEKRLVMKKTL